jgi:GDP-D-mannose dehydratase
MSRDVVVITGVSSKNGYVFTGLLLVKAYEAHGLIPRLSTFTLG